MKDNWTTNMKQKLEGHKMTPPAGLWEGISSEMGLQEKPAPKIVAIKRWFWIAAMALVLVGFFLVYQFSQNEPFPQVVALTSQKQEASSMKEENPENELLALADIPCRVQNEVPSKMPVEISQSSPVETVQKVTEEDAQQVSEEAASQQVSEKAPHQPSIVTSRQPHSEEHHLTANNRTKQISVVSRDRQWSIGLNASGGLLAASSSGQRSLGQVEYPVNGEYSGYYVLDGPLWPDTSPKVYDYEAKHRLPVSIGLSVHYQLNPRLALLTGINYTYLYSEFSTSLYPNIHSEQKLHYLGVPVGLSWQFWKTNAFSVYLSSSAMLQKCLNEKPWQWSFNASAGAEYAITPLLGLYLEPSLGYYFHDGTSFEHYYKEHPLAPSIEFGLRLHILNK